MKNKMLIGLVSSLIAVVPFVAADIKTGPGIFIVPFVGLALIGGFIVGAVFLIRWIIKKIKSKQ